MHVDVVTLCYNVFAFVAIFIFISFGLCVCVRARATQCNCGMKNIQCLLALSTQFHANRIVLILFIQFHFIHFRISRICLLACLWLSFEKHTAILFKQKPCCAVPCYMPDHATEYFFCLIGTASITYSKYGCVADFLLFKEYSFSQEMSIQFYFLRTCRFVLFSILFCSVLFFQFFFISHTAYTAACLFLFHCIK